MPFNNGVVDQMIENIESNNVINLCIRNRVFKEINESLLIELNDYEKVKT